MAIQADGTTTQRALYARSKDTGGIVVFANASGNVVEITTSGRVILNGPIWTPGPLTRRCSHLRRVVYSRIDGGAGTSFYVKESGAGNSGWVAK